MGVSSTFVLAFATVILSISNDTSLIAGFLSLKAINPVARQASSSGFATWAKVASVVKRTARNTIAKHDRTDMFSPLGSGRVRLVPDKDPHSLKFRRAQLLILLGFDLRERNKRHGGKQYLHPLSRDFSLSAASGFSFRVPGLGGESRSSSCRLIAASPTALLKCSAACRVERPLLANLPTRSCPMILRMS